MRFQVFRSSVGSVSREPPCVGAVRGPESSVWPGEYVWYVELDGLESLLKFLQDNGGGLGLWPPEEGEEHPVLEIVDESDEDE